MSVGDDLQAGVAAILDQLELPAPPGLSAWRDIDLADATAGIGVPPPAIGAVDGSCGLFYRAKVHWFSGEPESGKGWVLCAVCAEQLNAGQHVVYVDFEDSATSVVGRLLALGVPAAVILERFHYVRPDAPSPAGVDSLCERVARLGVPLLVIDGVTEAMTLLGLDPMSTPDVARFLFALPRPLTDAAAAVVCVDHVTKSKEGRGRFAFGAQHKLAAVDGSAWTVEAVKPFSRSHDGLVRLTVANDRNGHWRRGDHVDVDVSVDPMRLTFAAPVPASEWEPSALMEKVCEHLALYPGTAKNDLTRLGKAEYVRLAVELLVKRGHVRIEQDGQRHKHYLTGVPYVSKGDHE